MKQPEIVLARWVDPFSSHGWHTPDDLQREIDGLAHRECVSVGFLVHRTKDAIGLAESLSPTGQIGCVTWLPRAAIRSMETLRKASKGD
jgi:ABC-type nitrate/sulfonate/bicarbonate transport system ATPase subunit